MEAYAEKNTRRMACSYRGMEKKQKAYNHLLQRKKHPQELFNLLGAQKKNAMQPRFSQTL